MRGFRSTLILLVIFAGLLGYIYFYEMKRPPAGEAEAKAKVFKVEPAKIDEVRIKAASGETTDVRRTGMQWELVSPVQARADDGEISGITTNLSSLEVQRVVEEAPKDLKIFGLATPRVEVGFKTAGAKNLTELYLGDKTATGGDLYAKLPNEKRVFLVSGYLESTFNRTPFDLRDKTVLQVDRDKVDDLRIEVSGQPAVELVKAGTDWRLKQPFDAPADFGTVESVLGRLQSVQMKAIAAAEGGDPKEYGLDQPAITATIGMGSARATLAIGKEASDKSTLYAHDLSRPAVFTVESSLADDLKKPVDAYRRKDLFVARSFTANRIEVTRNSTTSAFERAQGKSGAETWRQTAPGAAHDVDTAKMDAFVNKLTELTAQSFVDAKTKTGLDQPVATVVTRFDDGKKEDRVTFGKVGMDAFASRAGEPGAAKFDANQLDEALKALDAVTAAPAPKPTAKK